MTLAEYYALPDIEKLVLIEEKLAIEANKQTWIYSGTAGVYYLPWTEPEVVAVNEDGETLDERYSVAACGTTASTFFYDIWASRLYVHLTGGGDPGTMTGLDYNHSVIPFFWRCFTNRQERRNADPVVYSIEENILLNGTLDFWSSPTALHNWTAYTAGTSTVNRDEGTTYNSDSAYAARIDIDAGGDEAGFYQAFTFRPGALCRIRFKYLMTLVGDGASIRIEDSGGNASLDSTGAWTAGAGTWITIPNALAWAEYLLNFSAHPSYSEYEIRIRSNVADSVVYFDNAELTRFRQPQYYLPHLPEGSFPSLNLGVGDYYQPEDKLSFGTITFINDGWFYEKRGTYLWHNKEIQVKAGAIGIAYADLGIVIKAKVRSPEWQDGVISQEIKDPQISELLAIPRERYDRINFPDIESSWADKERPLLFGKKTNITPPCIAASASGALTSTGEKTAGTVELDGHWTDCTVARLAAIDAVSAHSHDTAYGANSYFCLSDFNFGIPAGSTIADIQATVVFSANGHPYKASIRCAISKNDGASWSLFAKEQTVWNETYRAKIFTGAAAIPGWPWTPADFADGTFQLKVDGKISNSSWQIRVDYVSVKIFYSTPGAIPAFTYEVSQAVFDGTTVGIEAVDAVYKAGIPLATPADYTPDLPNGRFTLTADPGTDVVTCDARGLKCDFVTPGDYSSLAADIGHFILTRINKINEERLKLATWLDLKMERAQELGLYLASQEDTTAIFKKMKASVVAHLFCDPEGFYVAKRYIPGTTAATPVFRDEDYDKDSFRLSEKTEKAFEQVILKFDQDPTASQIWKFSADENLPTFWKHDEKNSLTIETYLTDPTDADDTRDFYKRLVQDPADQIKVTLGDKALLLAQADKAIFYHEIIKDGGTTLPVLAGIAYRILELDKGVDEGRVEITGLRDIQST